MSNKKDINSKSIKKTETYSPNMLLTYREHVVPAMVSRFNYENSMQVPKLLSISLNMGLGDAKTNSKKLESAIKEIDNNFGTCIEFS
jgi:ribosomal protein L5